MRKVLFLFLFIILCCAYSQGYDTLQTVAQDGSADFTSIQAAIDATKAFPDVPITILIKEGTYYEKVHVYAWNTNLSLIGDASGKTVISFDDYFAKVGLGRNSTFHTSTLKVEANDFYAENLTIENTAGEVGQAVAVHVEGDRVVFKGCNFLGNQDTMYLAGENARQYFVHCKITGTTDFIFGAATAVFDSCTILSKKESYITAASTPEGSAYGFVFRNCRLEGKGVSDGSVYLGRPWRGYAKTVFISCEMGSPIHPAGWKKWHTGGQVFYGEYGSSGPGGATDLRVSWSTLLTRKEAEKYSFANIFEDWTP